MIAFSSDRWPKYDKGTGNLYEPTTGTSNIISYDSTTGTGTTANGDTQWLLKYDIDIDASGTTGATYTFRGTDNTSTNIYTDLDFQDGELGWKIIRDTFHNGLSEADRKKHRLKTQHKSAQQLRGRPSFVDTLSPAEVTALQLLRSLVNPENFRKYLKYGFVTVQGMSGLIYNVYRQKNTIVYDGQTEVASLCVHLKGNQPPTDEVIAKVLMCECEEHEIWQRSNRVFRNKTPKLLQLGFDKLKRAA